MNFKFPFVLSLVLLLGGACEQMFSPQKTDPNVDMIHEFIEDVYTNQPQEQIAETYRFRPPEFDDTVAFEKFILLIRFLRETFKKEFKTEVIDLDKVVVEPYHANINEGLRSFNFNVLDFDDWEKLLDITFDIEDLYVVSFDDGKEVRYVLVKDNKIVSIFLLLFGKYPLAFFPYWFAFTEEEINELNKIIKEQGSSGDKILDYKMAIKKRYGAD